MSDEAEVRFMAPKSDIAVLDGMVAAMGGETKTSRAEIMREVLGVWAKRELHKATIICRVAARKPSPTEPARNES